MSIAICTDYGKQNYKPTKIKYYVKQKIT
jgi:hypothetical protein